jgi:hypothetical protein
MEEENIFDKIQEILGHMPSTFNILEEQIDIDLQMEYFEHSKKLPRNLNKEEIIRKREDVFVEGVPISNKKDLLVRLASIDHVEAFRTIEKYLKKPDPEIRDWALLALQESRMLLESKLLDQNQIFISTGLGGKGHKLRYFIVLLTRNGTQLSDLQEKVVRSEFTFFLEKVNSELEEIEFHPSFVKLLVVIPLQITIKDLFDRIIAECNEYGGFLQKHFILTNVKHLSNEEILEFLERKQDSGPVEE